MGNIVGIFSNVFQKNLYKCFKISLCYFVKVCVKFFPEICHFQSFTSPFTSPFLLTSSGYMDITLDLKV